MTEFEYAEFYALVQDSLYMQFLVINSVMVAYLVAGHFVGNKLPRLLIFALTTIYCLFLIAPFGVYWMEYTRLYELSLQYQDQYPGGFVVHRLQSPLLALFTLVPMFLAWVGTIYYVQIYVRSVPPSDT